MASPRIHVITGPTASGKTDRALQLARERPKTEIVNADASLLYRGFDIGTAKPDLSVRLETPHHLIDILEPHDQFTAVAYANRAREIIRDIVARDATPIVVGGTGLYINALFFGMMQNEIDPELDRLARERVAEEFEREGFDQMHARLKQVDPELYEQILRERNPLRLFRAWEYFYATGEPLGVARRRAPVPFEFEPEFEVLDVPRPILWERIERRTDTMLANGWLAEVARLRDEGVTRETPAMRAIGYRELYDVLESVTTLEQARERIVIRTRQYAKRQVTWMKRYPRTPHTQ